MSKVFIKTSHDYADEFDVDGLTVMDKDEFETLMKEIEAYFVDNSSVEMYFGSNEYIEFNNFNDYKRGVKAIDCPDEVAEFLEKNLGYHGRTFLDILDYV